MMPALAPLRRIARLLGPLLGLVLSCSLGVVAFHHHDESAAHHACAVCNASHLPAVGAAASAAAPVPAPRAERVTATPESRAPQVVTAAIAARGPPAA